MGFFKPPLSKLKEELQERFVVSYFRSPEELGKQVLQALISPELQERLREMQPTDEAENADTPSSSTLRGERTIRRIPSPPIPYIAHPIILKQSFVGRTYELQALDVWAASGDSTMIVEGIGGQGKSTLAWRWLQRVQQSHDDALKFDGVIWWSFYEENSALDALISDALTYLTGSDDGGVTTLSRAEREQFLLSALNEQRILLVLDGVERLLSIYTSAPQIVRDEVSSERFRKLSQRQDDEFIGKLIHVAPSRVLLTTRLIPSALENRNGSLISGVRRLQLEGLKTDDALHLLDNLGVTGSYNDVREFLEQFGNHALLLTMIAGRVLNYRPAPGNFDRWYRDEGQRLNLVDSDLVQNRSLILTVALSGMTDDMRKLLNLLASYESAVDYDTLRSDNPYATDANDDESRMGATIQLHNALQELEERGLMIWERTTNNYRLHPIVRAYVRETMQDD